MFKGLKSINTQYPELDRVQDFISNALTPILASKIADGILIDLVYSGTAIISTTGTFINHGLNRKINGWIITRLKQNVTIWENATTPPSPLNQISLSSSSNVTSDLSIWVF